MADALYKIFVVVMLTLIWFTAESAAQNAMEAHRHAHELACHIGAEDLCEFHEARND